MAEYWYYMSFMTVVPPVVEQLTTRMELQVRVEMCPINHYYLWREYREGCTGYCGQVATSACKVEMPRCSARNFAAVSQQFCESSWCLLIKEQVVYCWPEEGMTSFLYWGGRQNTLLTTLPPFSMHSRYAALLQHDGISSVDILNWDVFYCTCFDNIDLFGRETI